MVDIWSVPPQWLLFRGVPMDTCRRKLGLRSLSYVGDRLPGGDPLDLKAYCQVSATEAKAANKADDVNRVITEDWRAGYYLLGSREEAYKRLVALGFKPAPIPPTLGD